MMSTVPFVSMAAVYIGAEENASARVGCDSALPVKGVVEHEEQPSMIAKNKVCRGFME